MSANVFEGKVARVDLSTGDIARCSEIYEVLKVRAFGGDWRAMWLWTQRNLHGDYTM